MSDDTTPRLAPVIVLPVITTLDINVERVLNAALEAELDLVIVIGRTAEGEFYFASTKSDGGAVLWEMEVARMKLLGVL